MNAVWAILQILIGYNLILPLVLYFFFNLVKACRTKTGISKTIISPDYAVIVTAYQEISHIPATVNSILKSTYPGFICYVVLDNCDDIETLKFNDKRVVLLKPEKVLGGNVRSHFYAIDHFIRAHSFLTIIDSDNIVDENYLAGLNEYFNKGYKAVQGIRKAKNLNTDYACLDAARDIYYHFYDGLVLYTLGSSATLAGSGMAFETMLYKKCLEGKEVSGAGFDKVLQYEIVKKNEQIAFCSEAIVYDQKTARPDQLVNQRARWINTWFKYFKFGFSLLLKGVRNFSSNQLLFGLVLLRPPLFLFLLLSVIGMACSFFMSITAGLIWLGAFLCFVVGFIIPLRYYKADRRIMQALLHIPAFVYYQLVSLVHSRNANRRSVATKHFDE
ncbi:MAG: glycosyltransferase [Niabella sp.]